MSLYDLARRGDTEMLEVGLMGRRGGVSMDELAVAAIEGDHLETLEFIVDSGVEDIDYIYDMALSLGRMKIVEYLEEREEESLLDTAVSTGNIDIVRDMVSSGETTIDDVGNSAVLHGRPLVLRYALKHGASDYDRMIETARDMEDTEIEDYLVDMKEGDEWLVAKGLLNQ